MAQKFIELSAGKLAQKEASVVSTGVSQAGAVVALDSTGKLDVSVLPTGVGPDVAIMEATEALTGGDYVNIYDSGGGVQKVRLADNSNSRDAHGFVKTSFAIGANATIYFEGPNDALSGLTAGQRRYLGVAGQSTATPPSAPAAQIHQFLGIAIAPTAINTDIDDCIKLV